MQKLEEILAVLASLDRQIEELDGVAAMELKDELERVWAVVNLGVSKDVAKPRFEYPLSYSFADLTEAIRKNGLLNNKLQTRPAHEHEVRERLEREARR